MNDAELMHQFESATLTGDQFPHSEHVRVAWLYLREHSLHDVLERFPRHLRALAAALGADGLYHETVTWFFLMLVHDRIARLGSRDSWDDFLGENADLLEKSSAIMNRYYRPETWQSRVAKERFLLPDLIGA